MSPTTAAPERSLVQRMEALQRANEVRTKRAALKRDLKAGRASIHVVLLSPPDYVETAHVFDILMAVPKYGRVKANKILQICRISPSKTIGGLSERQRAELISMLRTHAPRHPQRTSVRPHPDALTPFELEVLETAVALGSVTGSYARVAAVNLNTRISRISLACGSLKRRGLLDEHRAPTSAGRARAGAAA